MGVKANGGLGCVGVRNNKQGYRDVIFAGGSVNHRTFDTSPREPAPEDDHLVFAVWSEGTAVPIPGAVWLLGSSLACLIGLRRKKK